MPDVPVSWAELIDKITILEIKVAALKSPAALKNVRRELALLKGVEGGIADAGELPALKQALLAVNKAIWDVEDRIREKEAAREFDAEFIELARAVYTNNDKRSAIKREINRALASELIEEKSYPVGPAAESA